MLKKYCRTQKKKNKLAILECWSILKEKTALYLKFKLYMIFNIGKCCPEVPNLPLQTFQQVTVFQFFNIKLF
jgi:hypothetical protein